MQNNQNVEFGTSLNHEHIVCMHCELANNTDHYEMLLIMFAIIKL